MSLTSFRIALFAVLGVALTRCSSDDGGPQGSGTQGGAIGMVGAGASSGSGGNGTGATGGSGGTGTAATGGVAGDGSSTGLSGSGGIGGVGNDESGGSTGKSGGAGTGGSSSTGGSAGGIGVDAGARPMFVYVGGYGGSIATLIFDPTTGLLSATGSQVRVAAVSFLAWTSPARFLYALSETSAGRVLAFSLNAATGALAAINDASSAGAGPACLLAVPSGKWLLVANYDGNTAAAVPVQANGGVSDAALANVQSFGGGTFPHQVALNPSEQFAFIPLKGSSAIAQFRFDRTVGKLTPSTPARVPTAMGAGPRHMVFHPSSKFAYVIDETVSTMVAYTHDQVGHLTELQTLSTRVATNGTNYTAEVAMHPSGKWLYGSNRGDDDIVEFAINETDGRMALVGHISSGGSTPRHFSIDPTGRFMFVGNQDSDNVVVFRIGDDGKLEPIGTPLVIAGLKPSFVGAVGAP